MSETDLIMIDATTSTPAEAWSLPRPNRTQSSDLAQERTLIRHKGQMYRACPKTAQKRGGQSFIW
jgi:hemin uptake protein HemP